MAITVDINSDLGEGPEALADEAKKNLSVTSLLQILPVGVTQVIMSLC